MSKIHVIIILYKYFLCMGGGGFLTISLGGRREETANKE